MGQPNKEIRLIFPNDSRKLAAKWVYKVVRHDTLRAESFDADINALAKEGWEMHTFLGDTALMRRDATGAQLQGDNDRQDILRDIREIPNMP
jgi:hypothetical protein